MPLHHKITPKKMLANLKGVLQKAPRAVGVIAVNHFEENFRKGGFVDGSLQKWKPRKDSSDPGRGVLIGKGSGRLSRSIRVINTSKMYVRVGTDIEYATIHNQGGITQPTVSPQMRKWAWMMFKRTKQARYKALALTPVGKRLKVKIPRRKFIGNSRALNSTINKWFIKQIKQAFSK